MTKLTRFLFAAAIISATAVAAATHPGWGRSANLTLLFVLLAALIAAGILAYRGRNAERRPAGKNLSPSLAALSSAAILAVYAAGYHRTSTAAGGFNEESNRRKPPVVTESGALAAPLSEHPIEPAAQDPRAPTIATQRTKSQQKGHQAKSARPSMGTDFTSSRAAAEYAPAASLAPQTPVSSIAPSTSTPAAPQIATNAADPNVAVGEPAAPAPPSKAVYKDGTYYGWGSCRHGDIQASVTIQDGKIASAGITRCLTRYSCSWIADLPNQVVKRQSPEVDYVSGASQSTDAFYGAVVSALSKARN